jgi:misacylated tRNA(Ala) deacylase
MTELLYLTSMDAAYERAFEARVTARPPGGLVLDRTLFYPAGGGQPADRGELTTEGGEVVPVVDVVKSGVHVLHRTGRARKPTADALVVGAAVRGSVDWARRHRHMRLHTAQHLVSALAFARFGRRTSRAVLGGEAGELDLEPAATEGSAWRELEAEANRTFASDTEVRVRWVSRAEWEAAPAARSGLVPLPANVDPVRLIEIDGFDLCPCGGTHVRSTREVGSIAFAPPSPLGSGATRLRFTLSGAAPTTPPE